MGDYTMASQPNGRVRSVFLAADLTTRITADADIALEYRKAMEEERSVTLPRKGDNKVDDAQIVAAVRAIAGDESSAEGEAVRDARLDALAELVTRDTELEDLRQPAPLSEALKNAVAIGNAISGIADSYLERAADSNETRIGVPLHLALDLMKKHKEWGGVFAKNGYPIRCPGVLSFPVPGSSYLHKEGTWGNDINNLDIKEVKIDPLSEKTRVERF